MIFLKKAEIEKGYNDYLFLKDDLENQIPELLSNINARLEIEPGMRQVVIKGSLTYRLKLQCSRCAEEYETIIKENSQLIISRETYEEGFIGKKELDAYLNNSIIDLSQWIYDTILLSIPIKPLCKEDCKGLCPICGTNLNFYSCDCHVKKKNEIDPRWEPLLKMMQKGGKENGSTTEKEKQ